MDDFFRTQQSPRGEPQVTTGAFISPPRNGGPLLPRRFTAESGRVPTLSTVTTIPRAAEPQDFASTTVRPWRARRWRRRGGEKGSEEEEGRAPQEREMGQDGGEGRRDQSPMASASAVLVPFPVPVPVLDPRPPPRVI